MQVITIFELEKRLNDVKSYVLLPDFDDNQKKVIKRLEINMKNGKTLLMLGFNATFGYKTLEYFNLLRNE